MLRYLLRIYLLSGRALLLGARTILFWVFKWAQSPFVYYIICTFAASCLACGWHGTRSAPKPRTQSCLYTDVPLHNSRPQTRCAWHSNISAYSLLTLPLLHFAYRVKREANKIFLLQATMSISTNSTITIMRLPVHHHNLKMMSDNLTSSPATRAPTHPTHP